MRSLDRCQVQGNTSAEVDRFGNDWIAAILDDVVEVVVSEMEVVESELGSVLESELEGLLGGQGQRQGLGEEERALTSCAR